MSLKMKQQLLAKYPKLKNQKFSIAVNQKITSENIVLKDGDVIALIPPFSGG
jgi:molybdopterin converting factor small subunit